MIYVLHMNTRGDNGVSYWFTWYMFCHSTHGFPRWHWGNLCIGVDACSCLCLSDRNLGTLFEVLCVGLSIMNMNLLWCYFSTNSRIDRTEKIALRYFSMNSWIDWSEIIDLRWFRTLQTISILCSLLDRNFGVILRCTLRDGYTIQLYYHYWEIALAKVRTLGLIFKHCNTVCAPFYQLMPCCFFNVLITKINIFYPYYTCITISSPN